MIDARLDELWRDGTFRGAAAELAGLSAPGHPREAELRAFAILAALRENERALLATLPGLLAPAAFAPAPVRALVDAANAWLAATRLDTATTWEAQRRLAAALDQAAAARPRATPRKGEPAPPERPLGTARAWGSIAVAECAIVGGELDTARRHLDAVVAAVGTPPGCRLAAGARLAELDGVAQPQAAVRRLDGVAQEAGRLRRSEDLQHALTIGGLLSLAASDRAGGRLRLTRATATEGSRRHNTLARMLLAVTEDKPDSSAALEQLADAIRSAAADGDYFSYVTVLGLAARVYHARGADADAVLTLSNGLNQLRATGLAALAAPLEAHREALREELGEQRYEQAAREALELLERDLQRIA